MPQGRPSWAEFKIWLTDPLSLCRIFRRASWLNWAFRFHPPPGIPVEVLDSWLLTLNTARNICAHHDRLWNRRLGNCAKIPREPRYPEWHVPYKVNNSTTFTLLTILSFLLESIAPSTSWHKSTLELLSTRSEDDLKRMGFSSGWQLCPIWEKRIITPSATDVVVQKDE